MNNRAKKQAEVIAGLLPKLMRNLNKHDACDPIIHLPLAQLRICRILELGPCSMSALSAELGISLSAVTQMADRLEKSNFVERVPDSDDRRVKLLKLSERGAAAFEERLARRMRQIEVAMRNLSEQDCDRIIESLRLLVDAASIE